MGAKEEAVALKDEGNKAIANREWGKAVELYTKAIELDGAQCVFYSNRAQVVYCSFVPRYSPQTARIPWGYIYCTALEELPERLDTAHEYCTNGFWPTI